MMKILIVGGKGQLGSEVTCCLKTMKSESLVVPEEYSGATIHSVDKSNLDITNFSDVERWYRINGPYDVTINCAAYTNVDECERNEYLATMVNGIGPRNLAECVRRFGGKIVHVSTDYVFPGTIDIPRVETDAIQPISAYGRSKWVGELMVSANCPKAFIVRTAWLYGYNGNNFVKTIIRLAKTNRKIQVVNDQWGSPTNANDVAALILKLALTDEYGVYHCTNSGICTWFDFACKVVTEIGIDCYKLPLSTLQYKSSFPNSADRPEYSVLSNRKLKNVLNCNIRQWDEALTNYLNNLKQYGGQNVI